MPDEQKLLSKQLKIQLLTTKKYVHDTIYKLKIYHPLRLGTLDPKTFNCYSFAMTCKSYILKELRLSSTIIELSVLCNNVLNQIQNYKEEYKRHTRKILEDKNIENLLRSLDTLCQHVLTQKRSPEPQDNVDIALVKHAMNLIPSEIATYIISFLATGTQRRLIALLQKASNQHHKFSKNAYVIQEELDAISCRLLEKIACGLYQPLQQRYNAGQAVTPTGKHFFHAFEYNPIKRKQLLRFLKFKRDRIIKIAGYNSVFALDETGILSCIGNNPNGMLGSVEKHTLSATCSPFHSSYPEARVCTFACYSDQDLNDNFSDYILRVSQANNNTYFYNLPSISYTYVYTTDNILFLAGKAPGNETPNNQFEPVNDPILRGIRVKKIFCCKKYTLILSTNGEIFIKGYNCFFHDLLNQPFILKNKKDIYLNMFTKVDLPKKLVSTNTVIDNAFCFKNQAILITESNDIIEFFYSSIDGKLVIGRPYKRSRQNMRLQKDEYICQILCTHQFDLFLSNYGNLYKKSALPRPSYNHTYERFRIW